MTPDPGDPGDLGMSSISAKRYDFFENGEFGDPLDPPKSPPWPRPGPEEALGSSVYTADTSKIPKNSQNKKLAIGP